MYFGLKQTDKKGGRKVKCDGDCLNCKFDDCIASTKDILVMESQEKGYYTGLGTIDELSDEQKKYLKKRDRVLAKAKADYVANKEKYRKRNREQYLKRKEDRIARAIQWQKEHADQKREYDRERKRRKRNEIKENNSKTV